jgi:uncharacterized membrane protein YjgN (DUF898 family)
MTVEAPPAEDDALARPAWADLSAPTDEPLVFTGDGGEYFRIWVVNTVLSIVTLGIYSAWAKVRKASYFSRNTLLLGDGFEYTANPLAILRGRLLAVALFTFYTFAFNFSLVLGLVATTILFALAPLLFASAQRFRLHNTRWRALRFEFTATRADAYRTVSIVVGMWLSTNLAAALGGEVSVAVVGAITGLLLPWMHHRLKAFQHRHVEFGGHRSQFRSALGNFYATYVLAGLILMVGALLGGLLATAALASMGTQALAAVGWAFGALSAAIAYLAAWPYFAARMQHAVWTRTSIGPYAFRTTIRFGTLLPIAIKNFALLVATAGLYWPYASIAWARYRIGCMHIVSPSSAEHAVAALTATPVAGTVGEGAVDFFGIDVGW